MSNVTQINVNPNTKPLVIGEFSIRQDEDGRYCLNDLHKASGGAEKHKPTRFVRNQQTQELIAEIEAENNQRPNMVFAIKTLHGGVNSGTYVVEDLVYSYAMWISAKFHLIVIRAYRSLVMDWKINDKQTISVEQAGILYNIVHTRAKGNGGTIAGMWSRLKNHFGYSASYRDLKAFHFEDAKFYLENMEIKAKSFDEKSVTKPIDNSNIQALAIHMIWAYKWWDHFGGAIRILNPHMAGLANEHFVSGMCLAYNFLEQPTKLAIDEKAKYYTWK